MVQQAGSIRVTELARQLRVTEETIRRDLDRLDRLGKVVRIHGGAIPVQNDHRELPFDVRRAANLKEKQAIAAAAAEFVAEGDVIALDASSTAVELARVLPDVPLTVVTNSLAIVSLLLDRKRILIVSTGGVMDTPSLSYVSTLAERALERFNIGKLFFSSKGVDLHRGLSVAEDDHARLKRRMMELAEKKYLLVDHTKLGVRSVVFFADVRDVDCIVTDAGASTEMLDRLRKSGPIVVQADA